MRLSRHQLEKILRVAQLAAMDAGDYALEKFTLLHVLKEKPLGKGVVDVLSKVDLVCERRIVKILKKNFPGHTLLTEERPLPKKLKKDTWWIDPLDGTVSYVFNLPYWGISLALIHQKEVVVGVSYFPLTRDLLWAIKKQGAFQNYRKITVSKHKKLVDGLIGMDYGYQGERKKGAESITLKIIDELKFPLLYTPTTVATAFVAQGKLAGYIHHMARRYDLAAGALLVTEAGGQVSNTYGQPIDWRDTQPVQFVCTNGKIHQELIKTLQTEV